MRRYTTKRADYALEGAEVACALAPPRPAVASSTVPFGDEVDDPLAREHSVVRSRMLAALERNAAQAYLPRRRMRFGDCYTLPVGLAGGRADFIGELIARAVGRSDPRIQLREPGYVVADFSGGCAAPKVFTMDAENYRIARRLWDPTDPSRRRRPLTAAEEALVAAVKPPVLDDRRKPGDPAPDRHRPVLVNSDGSLNTAAATLLQRCGHCADCLRHRAARIAEQARCEVKLTPTYMDKSGKVRHRTWAFTATLDAQERYLLLVKAERFARREGLDWDTMSPDAKFRIMVRADADEVRLATERLRKLKRDEVKRLGLPAATASRALRYLRVVEAHKPRAEDGGLMWPHYHWLLFEQYDLLPFSRRELQGSTETGDLGWWRRGHVRVKLVDAGDASYCCKYISKTDGAVVRKSAGFGRGGTPFGHRRAVTMTPRMMGGLPGGTAPCSAGMRGPATAQRAEAEGRCEERVRENSEAGSSARTETDPKLPEKHDRLSSVVQAGGLSQTLASGQVSILQPAPSATFPKVSSSVPGDQHHAAARTSVACPSCRRGFCPSKPISRVRTFSCDRTTDDGGKPSDRIVDGDVLPPCADDG